MTFNPLTRREMLGTMPLAAVSLAAPSLAATAQGAAFPHGFLWGAATAAHQVEGNNINSDWWLLESLPDFLGKEPSGDAVDHYHLYPQDIALLAKLGLNTYRFSIEWARVEPSPGHYSLAELNHYRDMLETCRRHGLKTVVTLHHFTSPRWLVGQKGFENPQTVDLFARYAAKVVSHCGDLIDYLCTFNEANLSFTGFLAGQRGEALLAAAAKANGSDGFTSFLFDDSTVSKPIVRQCHRAARAAVKAIRPSLSIGLTLAMTDIQDAPDSSGYGKAKRSEAYDVWLEAARGDDFLCVQNYTREMYGPHGRVEPDPSVVKTQIGQEYYPMGLAGAVRYAAAKSGIPILVTENGIGIQDDTIRIRYTRDALAGLRDCIHDGVDVRGYIHWSAMDNFEWTFSYGPKFGLIAVDRTTFQRIPKPSAYVLGKIAQANRLIS